MKFSIMDIDVNFVFVTSFVLIFKGTSSHVTISPLAITVVEGHNATVRCFYDRENSIQGGIFYFNESSIATIFVPNCTFNALGFDNYKTDCEGNRTLLLTLVNVSRSDHGKHISCRIFPNSAPPVISRNSAQLFVNVPLERIFITSKDAVNNVVTVCEKIPLNFQCETSPARPAPNITWIYKNNSSSEEISSDSTVRKDKNDLFITTSTLTVNAKRSFTSFLISCSARNIDNGDMDSSRLSFNILYPPDKSPFILNVNLTNGDTYNVIEGRHGLLICAIPTSNPIASLSWRGSSNSQNITSYFVVNKLQWMASRRDEEIPICIAKHVCDNYYETLSTKIRVLYPPTVNGMNDISVIEGSMLNVSCNVTLGMPKAATFKWTTQKDILIANSQFLLIQNITREFSSTYTCNVANVMKPSAGPIETGENSGSIDINVLYPPSVNQIKDFTVMEGANFSIACPFNPGIPKSTNITWMSSEKRTLSANEMLSFRTVSRKYDMMYTCIVSNNMTPSYTNKVTGTAKQSFHLIVEYLATVELFYIKGYYQNSYVTVNENENVTFFCNVDSNPISSTDITLQSGQVLKSATSNNVSYILGPAKCIDAGTYECSGINRHNSVYGTRRFIRLLVKCSPREHPSVSFRRNFTAALNSPVVMKFAALSFPQPYIVLWQKLNNNTWTNVMLNSNVTIDLPSLNYSLTIPIIKEKDLGEYRIVIANEIGQLKKHFFINAKEYNEQNNGVKGYLIGGIVSIIVVLLGAGFAIFIIRHRKINQSKRESARVIYQNDINIGKGITPAAHYDTLDVRQRVINESDPYEQLGDTTKFGKEYNLPDKPITSKDEPLYTNMEI